MKNLNKRMNNKIKVLHTHSTISIPIHRSHNLPTIIQRQLHPQLTNASVELLRRHDVVLLQVEASDGRLERSEAAQLEAVRVHLDELGQAQLPVAVHEGLYLALGDVVPERGHDPAELLRVDRAVVVGVEGAEGLDDAEDVVESVDVDRGGSWLMRHGVVLGWGFWFRV